MNDRKTEIFKNGHWVKKAFEDVEIGERFRLFEPDGARVTSESGSKQWIATTRPYMNDDGVWEVERILI